MPRYNNSPTEKIDSRITLGLSGINNSLAYRTHEIETHLHGYESWFETASVPNAEIHVADRIGDGAGAFVVDAGNDTWGGWVQLLGSSDTPARSGNIKYDLHRITITDAERTAEYFVQIALGASGSAALTAGTYTEFVYAPISTGNDETPVDFQTRRMDVGTKAWARCLVPGANTGTLTFYIGLHEYPG